MKNYIKLLCSVAVVWMVLWTSVIISYADNGQSQVSVSIDSSISTKYIHHNNHYYDSICYTSETPNLTSFWDKNEKYNIVYGYSNRLIIQRYDKEFRLEKKISIPYELPYFGNITSDGEYYYVVWGQYALMNENAVVNCTAKYNMDGIKVACCDFKAIETSSSGIGASSNDSCSNEPFNFAGCELDLKNGILACNYGRVMFNGHQSNFVFYIDTVNMNRINETKGSPYCSHSFFQDVLITSDGGYLTLNLGDAYSRGIEVAKVSEDGTVLGEFVTFHFRENPAFYQNVFAQLGGAIETYSGYVVCGTSENSLSFDKAANERLNESRNLFIQVIKKDFYTYSDPENRYLIDSEKRVAAGTPLTGQDGCYLAASWGGDNQEKADYGVIWLTQYTGDYYACNPKIINVDNYFAVMWERRKYYDDTKCETYYMLLDSNYEIVKEATLLDNVFLPVNVMPQYKDGCIYWTTSGDGFGTRINILDVYAAIGDEYRSEKSADIKGYSLSLNGNIGVNCYIDISEGLINDVNSKVVISNGSYKNEISIFNLQDKDEHSGYYIFTIETAAKEMRDEISFEVYSGNELIVKQSVSVYDYAQAVINNAAVNDDYSKAKPLVEAMLNYGGYAQLYFDYKTEQLANEGVYTEDTDPVKTKTPIFPTQCRNRIANAANHENTMMTFCGSSLVCDSNTTLICYFLLKNPETAVSEWSRYYYSSLYPYEISDTCFTFKFENLSPANFNKVFSISYYHWDTSSWYYFVYSPMDYLYLGTKSGNEKLADLCKAMYYYYEAAVQYK